MAIIVLDNYGGLESAPTPDVIAPGKSPVGWNYRLSPMGPGGRGMRTAPGRTRIYRGSLRDQDATLAHDRVALLLAEPGDFNADRGAVLIAAEKADNGRIVRIHHHEDISQQPYEPITNDGWETARFIHDQYSRVRRLDLDDLTLERFAIGYWYPGKHGLYPEAVASNETMTAQFLRWQVHPYGGLVGVGVRGRVTIIDHHLALEVSDGAVPESYDGESGATTNWERFQVTEFNADGSVASQTNLLRLQSAAYNNAETSPRGRSTEMLSIAGNLLFVSNSQMFLCRPGAVIYDPMELMEEDGWGGGPEIVASICQHNENANDFLVGLFGGDPELYHCRITSGGVITVVDEIEWPTSGEYAITHTVPTPVSHTEGGINKIVPLADGSGYLVFSSDYDGLRTGDDYTAANKKITLMDNDLEPVAQVEVSDDGWWSPAAAATSLGVVIALEESVSGGESGPGVVDHCKVYDPEDLSELGELGGAALAGIAKGFVERDGGILVLEEQHNATGGVIIPNYPDSALLCWNPLAAASSYPIHRVTRFDENFEQDGDEVILATDGGPVAQWG